MSISGKMPFLHTKSVPGKMVRELNKRKFNKRRYVKNGHPATKKQFSAEEVREYFSHDKITCLLCGCEKNSLGTHLRKIHGITAIEYKNMYGLPLRKGLTGTETRKRASDAVRARMDNGWYPPAGQFLESARHSLKKAGYRKTKYMQELATEKINAYNSKFEGRETCAHGHSVALHWAPRKVGGGYCRECERLRAKRDRDMGKRKKIGSVQHDPR